MADSRSTEFRLEAKSEQEAQHIEMLIKIMYGEAAPTLAKDAIPLLRLCDQYQAGELTLRIAKGIIDRLDYAAACAIVDLYGDVPVNKCNSDLQIAAAQVIMKHFAPRAGTPDAASDCQTFMKQFEAEVAALSFHVMQVLVCR
jgi:hypothetical protein